MPKGNWIRKKTERDRYYTVSPTDIVKICTECNLPEKDCDKQKCERYNRMSKLIREGKSFDEIQA